MIFTIFTIFTIFSLLQLNIQSFFNNSIEIININCNISISFPVSVLIPIYNKAHYLQRSFGSLKNQTFTKFEIVAVDDCSTDSSSEFVLETMKTDSRISFIQHKYNQGICNSRNHAVLTSRGQYIMSLDPDDAYVNNSIELAYQSALEYNADMLEFRIGAIHRNYTDYNWMNCRISYFQNEVVLTKLQRFRYGNPDIHTCKKIIRRSVYLKAVNLILPYIKDKRICISEDLLHVGTVLIFARNYICTQHLVYLYYRNAPDSSINKGYVTRKQKIATGEYVKQILRYFYRYRKNPQNCNVSEFFSNPNNTILYNTIFNFDKYPKKNLSSFYNYGFSYSDFINDGYVFFFH